MSANPALQTHGPNRVDLVIIRALLLVRSDFRYSVAARHAVRALEKP
jgi:hypothetical protein